MNALAQFDELLTHVEFARFVPFSYDMNTKVRRVVVILSACRSGSTLLKTVLSENTGIASFPGEEEPYYVLARMGFPFTSDSDVFEFEDGKHNANMQHVLSCMFDDLGVPYDNSQSYEYVVGNRLKHQWKNRLPLQYLHTRDRRRVFSAVEETFAIDDLHDYEYMDLVKELIYRVSGTDLGCYDGSQVPFTARFRIEKPPFVVVPVRRQFHPHDVEDKTILLKTPQDCYRVGIFEQLFPNADIKYIHLTRGFAQTINGLMDGWLSPYGFFAHNMELVSTTLNMPGYSDVTPYGRTWWKFDLPPNWRAYTNRPLHEVCTNQWMSSHRSILESGVDTLHVRFEDFLINPQHEFDRIAGYTGMCPMKIGVLPVTMATDKPERYRWHKRKSLMMQLAEDNDVVGVMGDLGYDMTPEEWI